MITKIQIKNINAIKETTINFEKSRYHYLCDNIYNEKLVSPIAFYGTNGSGKTSFIKAIAQMVEILIAEPGSYSLFIPNLFADKINPLSSIKIWFVIENIRYIYEIKTHFKQGIVEESLTSNDKKIFYKKDENNYFFNNNVVSLSSPDFSVLRKIGNELINEEITKAYQYLSNIVYIDATKTQYLSKLISQKSMIDLMVEQSQEVEKILKDYQHFPVYTFGKNNSIEGKKNYFFSMNISGKQKSLNSYFMSTGMINQSAMLSILTALPKNSLMLIDEIEDALHPLTIMDFINIAKEKNIQLIFTSHNTYILQKLRPDQVIFANWKEGYSTYKKLSDIYPNIREVNNIEKMYLSRMFDEEIESNE